MPPKVWNHVPTSQNPADCASRGISARELISHELWWHGPPWLQKSPLILPVKPGSSETDKQKDEEHRSKKKEPQLCSAALPISDAQLEGCSNSLITVIRVTCWVKRFISRTQKKRISSDRNLSVAEFIATEEISTQIFWSGNLSAYLKSSKGSLR